MYVFVYVFMRMCILIHYVHIQTYFVNACLLAYMYIYVYVCMYMYIYVYMYVCMTSVKMSDACDE